MWIELKGDNTEPAERYLKRILVNSCIRRLQRRKKKLPGLRAETGFNLQNYHSSNTEARVALCTTSQLNTAVVLPEPFPPHAAGEGHEDKPGSCSSRVLMRKKNSFNVIRNYLGQN